MALSKTVHAYAKRNTHVGNVSVMGMYLGTVATLIKLDTRNIDVSWVNLHPVCPGWLYQSGKTVHA